MRAAEEVTTAQSSIFTNQRQNSFIQNNAFFVSLLGKT